MTTPPRECRECGVRFTPTRQDQSFHTRACLIDWRNRRAKRGAILYDFAMSERFERTVRYQGETVEAWARRIGHSLTAAFRNGDKHERGGRKSWRPFCEAVQDLPLVFNQKGDGR